MREMAGLPLVSNPLGKGASSLLLSCEAVWKY